MYTIYIYSYIRYTHTHIHILHKIYIETKEKKIFLSHFIYLVANNPPTRTNIFPWYIYTGKIGMCICVQMGAKENERDFFFFCVCTLFQIEFTIYIRDAYTYTPPTTTHLTPDKCTIYRNEPHARAPHNIPLVFSFSFFFCYILA